MSIRISPFLLGLAAIACSNSPTPSVDTGCPVLTVDAGSPAPTPAAQCLRTGAYLSTGVREDLATSVDATFRTEWGVRVAGSVNFYMSYGVDGVEILSPTSTWSDSVSDGTFASSQPVARNLRITFGGTISTNPAQATETPGYRAAKALFDAMTLAQATVDSGQTSRTSPKGFVTCDSRNTPQETAYSCTITNVVQLETTLAACSDGFNL